MGLIKSFIFDDKEEKRGILLMHKHLHGPQFGFGSGGKEIALMIAKTNDAFLKKQLCCDG